MSERLNERHALALVAPLWCKITGADLAAVMGPTRGSWLAAQTRHMIGFFMVAKLGYRITYVARVMPGRTKEGCRHHSTLYNSRIRASLDAELGEDLFEIADLIDWAMAHWRDPIEQHAASLAKRRAAFERVIAKRIKAGAKLGAGDFAAALTAASKAASVRLKDNEAPQRPTTAVPVFDEPPAVLVLKHSPIVEKFNARIEHRRSSEGGTLIDVIAGDAKALVAAAKALLTCGFRSEQRYDHGKLMLHVAAPALAALLAAIHIAAPSRIVSPIDGAHGPAHGPSHATA